MPLNQTQKVTQRTEIEKTMAVLNEGDDIRLSPFPAKKWLAYVEFESINLPFSSILSPSLLCIAI